MTRARIKRVVLQHSAVCQFNGSQPIAMLREQLIQRHIGEHAGFRWRGQEVSRLEGFSDAMFAFVVTLLVISTEVPKNFSDLIALFSFSNVGSFAICFVFLVGLWRSHYIFFRRYG